MSDLRLATTRQETSSSQPAFSSQGNWAWVVAICAVLGVFEATQTVLVMRAEGMHHAWVKLFLVTLMSWAPWAVWGGLILRLGRTHPLFQGSSVSGWLRHAGLWLAVWASTAGWNAAIEASLNPWAPDTQARAFPELWRLKLSHLLLESLFLYAAILLMGWMLDSRERLARQRMDAAELSEQLAKAQLSALRQQIEPHFLFNTLNTIAGLVREGRGDSAVDMIAGLSELLRRTLRSSGQQQVVLREELEIAEKYLEIEKARFAERLQVHVEVPEELRKARVPSLILQPIVENAVKHGIAKRVDGGEIAISAARENSELRVSVRNDGPGFAEGWESKKGIGLKNVRERLASLYGKEAELRVSNGDGVVVTIVVPYRDGGLASGG
jgi:two-component system, LytTR family, sensor kinase